MLFFCLILISEINLTMIQKLIIFVIKVVFFGNTVYFIKQTILLTNGVKSLKTGMIFLIHCCCNRLQFESIMILALKKRLLN
jgi:hypothetical protein